MTKVIQAMLQDVTEENLLELQCDFHESCGCSDIFVIHQLVMTTEQHSKQFLISVNLTKAYKTVS